MLQWVFEGASHSGLFDTVLVATDHPGIQAAAQQFGAPVAMTDPQHPSGTDRIREALIFWEEKNATSWDLVVNIQGDEPLLDRSHLLPLIDLFTQNPVAEIGTLSTPFLSQTDLLNPNMVKVVSDQQGKALYFSRSPIPYVRQQETLANWLEQEIFQKHIGLYAFRPEVLKKTSQLAVSSLEQMESLEQLRWLQAGINIYVGQTRLETIGVDTPEDLERATRILQAKQL